MSKITETYMQRTPKSGAATARAVKTVFGANSRGGAVWAPYPTTVDHAEGPRVFDLDGNAYIDMINNYTSLIHGNAYPPITEAVTKQIAKGSAWAANNEHQAELAELLVERVDSVDNVRFVNSGSEAGMLALNVAREVTGRQKILMARYGYHGVLMEFEVGSFGGQVFEHADTTYLGEWGDAESFEKILAEHGDEICAVFLEAVIGSGGVIQAPPEFFERVKKAAHAAGALFVLDEVITFRMASGGHQANLGITPDLTMFGKLIGGGYPVGAIGGNAEIMGIFDPTRMSREPGKPYMFHSGTFCANPVTMAAGVVSVRELTAERIAKMASLAERLEGQLRAAAEKVGLSLAIRRCGSLLNLYFMNEAPEATMLRKDEQAIALFNLAALNHGVQIAPRGFVVLSTVMDEALIDDAGERLAAAMADVAAEL